jgi:hypothetical protein
MSSFLARAKLAQNSCGSDTGGARGRGELRGSTGSGRIELAELRAQRARRHNDDATKPQCWKVSLSDELTHGRRLDAEQLGDFSDAKCSSISPILGANRPEVLHGASPINEARNTGPRVLQRL